MIKEFPLRALSSNAISCLNACVCQFEKRGMIHHKYKGLSKHSFFIGLRCLWQIVLFADQYVPDDHQQFSGIGH
jgi:hypothetical protein